MFCFRLSFFPRGVGPGGRRVELRAGQPDRAGGFRPSGWLRAGQPDRATGPDRWLQAGRANHLFNWRLGPVSQHVVQPVLQPVVQSVLQPKQSPVLQPVVQSSLQPTQSSVLQPVVHSSLQPTQSPALQPVLQQPSNRRKVRPFNRSFNRRSRQSCQCTSTEVADNATRFRKNSIGNPQKFM